MPDLYVTGFIDQMMDADRPLEALGIISRMTGLAGENINNEESIVFYYDDAMFYRTSALYKATSAGLVGIALTTASSGDVMSGQFLGVFYPTGYLTGKGEYFLATGYGLLTTGAPTGIGDIIRPFGYSISYSGFMIYPDPTYLRVGDISTPAHASNHTDGTDDIQLATSAQKGLMSSGFADKLDGVAVGATANQTDAYLVDRTNHTGAWNHAAQHTNGTDDIQLASLSQKGLMSSGYADKLDGVAVGATANQTDAYLLNLVNHTGLNAYHLNRVNHTGVYTHASNHVNGTDDIQLATSAQKGLMSSGYADKLDGVAVGATANQTDAYLINRTNHTGNYLHAANHVNGTDDIQDATAGQKGLMTTTYAAKLDATETGARVLTVNGATGAVVVKEWETGINTQTASYTLAYSDSGKIIEMNVTTANLLTIPANATTAFGSGVSMDIVQIGTGLTSVTGAAGVTVNGVSAGGVDLAGQFFAVSIYKRAINTWVAIGGA